MMPDQREQQNRQGGKAVQQRGGGGQKSDHLSQQPNQKSGQGSQQQGGSPQIADDQISFYDESLKKEIEGSFRSDGKSIHVSSAYGVKSAPYGDLGACIDHNAQVLLARKLLSEMARDAGGGHKDVPQQKDDQQRRNQQRQQPEPMQRRAQGPGQHGGGS